MNLNMRLEGISRNTGLVKFLLVVTTLFCALQNNSYAQEQESLNPSVEQITIISNVNIIGNKRIDKTSALDKVAIKKNNVTNEDISQGIKNLYSIGAFDQVTASIEGETLVFSVVEKPLVRKVFVKGNKAVKETDLVDVLTFGKNKFLDKSKLQNITRNGEAYYQSRGFYDTKIDASVVPVEENQVDVTFQVKEGDKFKIKKVVFRGLNQIDPDELRAVIETKRYKWWNSWLLGTGRLNKENMEADKQRLRQYFLDRGYVDVALSDAVIERSDEELVVAFQVKEGKQYTVRNITVSGDLISNSKQKTLDGIKTEGGDIFNATKVREDSFLISDKYGDEGYAFVNVVPNTALNRDQQKIDIDFTVSKGKKAKVKRISIKGNEKTYDNVIRRELKVAEQEMFSSKKVKRSETLLKRLGYFEEVGITTEPTDKDDEVNLDVNVKEAATGTFTAGAGYSTSDGALFSTRVSENNIFGTGRQFDAFADIGTERSNAQIAFTDPRLNDSYLSAGASLEATQLRFRDFDRETAGGGVNVGYPLEEIFGEAFEDINSSLRYDYLKVRISNVDQDSSAQFVKDSEGTGTASSITPRLVRNTINNPLNPTSGSKQVLSFEYAGPGGDLEYYLAEARNQWYYPFVETEAGPLVFSWRTRFGYGDALESGEKLPLFKRFFPGGINSVRGFKNRSLGPKDADGNEFGGSKEFVNNLEFIFPLVNSAGLRGVVFYDMGQAFDDEDSIDFSGLRKSYGFGFRWGSPIGPIRIEFGFPTQKENGEKSYETLFSFGAPL